MAQNETPATGGNRRIAVFIVSASLMVASLSWCLFRDNETRAPESAVPGRPSTPLLTETSESLRDDNYQDRSARTDDVLRNAGFDELLVMLRRKVASSASPEEILLMLRTIAETRPEVAIDLAAVIGRTDDERAHWVADVTRLWAARDPQAAWQWVIHPSHRLERISKDGLVGVVLNQMAQSAPEAVVQNLETSLRLGVQPETPNPEVVLHEGIRALVANGAMDIARAAIKEWANGPLKDKIAASAYESVAIQMADASPASAASWLKSLPLSDNRNFALGTLASTWVNHDAAAAMDWAESLSPLDGRVDTIQRTFNEWVERAPADAAEWLNKHRAQSQPGGEADRMITRLVAASPLVRSDPSGALQWAALISKPELRAQVIAGVVTKWGLSDSESATRYLQQSADLTPGQKAKVLSSWQDPATAERYAGEDADK
jgi:hypothetical protein